ncbi:MAG: DUF4350 domain-containing protein, partial [Sedimentisphaerales bacterium]
IYLSETSAQFLNHKIATSFKMQGSKLILIGAILILFVLLTPSAAFSYTVLWDTSHGVYVSGTFGGDGYQPSQDGYYQKLAEHLGNNDFTVDITSQGFLTDDPAGYDVIVVCLTSAFYSSYTSAEVDRIVDFVDDGGGLLIMGDRLAAPNANIQPVASEFGITLGLSDVVSSPPNIYELYTSELDLSHPVFSDFTTTDQIFLYAASELSVSGSASPISWQEGTGKIIAAATQYGQGRVVTLGDCSLWSWVETLEENFYESDNPQFAVSTFDYLAVPEPATLLLLGLGAALLRKRR